MVAKAGLLDTSPAPPHKATGTAGGYAPFAVASGALQWRIRTAIKLLVEHYGWQVGDCYLVEHYCSQGRLCEHSADRDCEGKRLSHLFLILFPGNSLPVAKARLTLGRVCFYFFPSVAQSFRYKVVADIVHSCCS